MALHDLKDALANRLVAVLRPLLTEALVARTVEALGATIDRILADTDHPLSYDPWSRRSPRRDQRGSRER